MTRRVLMVDDEEDLVWTTARQVRRERPDLHFEGVTSPEEALDRVRAAPPDVLVTDVRMPRMSGLELMLAVRRLCPQLPVVVVTAHGNAQVRTEVQRTHAVQYLEKPFAFEALFAAVDRALDRPRGFSGAISLPMLPDLVQMYALARMTGALQITRADTAGAIWFEGGDIVHAACGALEGATAFHEMLGWDGGSFGTEPGAAAPCRSITASWQELLMEGCRLIDERDRAGETAAVGGAPDAGATAPQPGSLAETARAAWAATSPRLLEVFPGALDVAVLAGLWRGPAVVVHGAADEGAWSAALDEAIAGLQDARTTAGSVEWTAPAAAIGVVWNAVAGLVFGVKVALSSDMSAARFRAGFVRWREVADGWLAEQARSAGA